MTTSDEAVLAGLVTGDQDTHVFVRCFQSRVYELHNLVHNRKLIVGLVVTILVAASIVLLVTYSGGGSGGGIY